MADVSAIAYAEWYHFIQRGCTLRVDSIIFFGSVIGFGSSGFTSGFTSGLVSIVGSSIWDYCYISFVVFWDNN